MSGAWDPDQYARFRNERSKPFFDLLALVRPIPGGRVIDLGCGTGELTQVLHQRSAARSTLGLDNSEAMLARAQAFAGKGLAFKLGTILRFTPRTPFDLVFANASLQWAPNHQGLLPRLAAGIAAGGQIAVQMPANHDHASHRIADAVAQEEPFASALSGYVTRFDVRAPEWYAETLDALGFVEQDVRLQVYPQHLAGPEEVVEWVKGTYLTAYQSRMPADLYPAYLERYRELLMRELPARRPFFYPYKRILFWGQKGPG